MSQNSYLFEKTYELLSPREKREFQSWLKVRLVDRKDGPVRMFELWLAGYNWEEIMAQLNLTGDKGLAALNRHRNKLQEELEVFLSWVALKKNEPLQRSLALYELAKRGAEYHLPIISRKYQKLQKRQQTRDGDYFRERYDEATVRQAFRVMVPPNFRKNEDLASDRWHHWSRWMSHELLQLGIALEQKQLPGHEQARSLIFSLYSTEQPSEATTQLMLLIYKCFAEQKWNDSNSNDDPMIFESLQQHKHLFGAEHFANLHGAFFNYLNRKLEFQHTLLDTHVLMIALMRWSLEEKLWPFNRQTYRNMATLQGNSILLSDSLIPKKIIAQEAFRFIDEYKAQLPDQEQDKAYQHCRAIIEFSLDNYDKIRISPPEFDFSDPYYDTSHDLLMLKIDLELSNFLYFNDKIKNLRQRVRRAKGIPTRYKQGMLNLLTLISKVEKVKTSVQARALLEEVVATRPLASRVWFDRFLNRQIESLPAE